MKFELRKANINDCNLLYYWVNDEQVRDNSFNSNKIDYEEHKEWLEKRLHSQYTRIFILEKERQRIGQIRIDIENTKAIIDYSIDKEYRGQSYGYKILNMLEHEIIANYSYIKILEGRVKLSNISSQKCFERNTYNKFIKESYVLYRKNL
ncbi:GNAT family N-acetyltransferase [Clostridium sporogenes]|uniref:GNAT family N-acetyltransferase n=1 Tax=Clostridium sporogenes TaxID=1509 RepID=UPI0006657852|nr:GNAT family N-acetyltransferase [Clostridium sporogenes]